MYLTREARLASVLRLMFSHPQRLLRLQQGNKLSSAYATNQYTIFPGDQYSDISCGTLENLVRGFELGDSICTEPDDAGGLLVGLRVCSYWQNVLYEFCGLCEEPPPPILPVESLACSYPCAFEDLELTNDECVRDYFQSLVLLDDAFEQGFCANLQSKAVANECCVENQVVTLSPSTSPSLSPVGDVFGGKKKKKGRKKGKKNAKETKKSTKVPVSDPVPSKKKKGKRKKAKRIAAPSEPVKETAPTRQGKRKRKKNKRRSLLTEKFDIATAEKQAHELGRILREMKTLPVELKKKEMEAEMKKEMEAETREA